MLFLELCAGLALLVAGGDLLVRGAVAFAVRLHVSPLLIGLTVVGFGTSTPELMTSLQAAFSGAPGIAIGNVVGSNTANILLILGLTAVLAPIAVRREAFLRDGMVTAASALACLAAVLAGSLERLTGALLLASLVGYIVYAARTERVAAAADEPVEDAPGSMPIWKSTAFTLFGLMATMAGARLLVSSSVELAEIAGISDTVIGLTVVAVGTSLPELVGSVMAALRRMPEVAFGNVLGSNIYNVLGILGGTALVHPIGVPPEILQLDVWVMLAATAALLVAAVTGWRITRREGVGMLGAYCAYLGILATA